MPCSSGRSRGAGRRLRSAASVLTFGVAEAVASHTRRAGRYAPRPWAVSRSGASFCRCSADADRRFRRGQRPISVALWRASSSRSWATLSSSIERPRSRLLRRHRRHFGAATRGPCQVGRFLRNCRPRHLVATAELSPGPRLLVGNAGGSSALLAFPPLTSGEIGRKVPDYVRCTCT